MGNLEVLAGCRAYTDVLVLDGVRYISERK